MAWNPSPEVAVARDAARKLRADQCIIIFLRNREGQMGYASYGETKALCAEANRLANELYNAASKWLEQNG